NDANSCLLPQISTFTIASTSNMNIATAQTNVSCFGQNNGTGIVNAAGGNAPYTYSWNSAPPQSTQTATGLAAGTYTVTVTDATSCSSTATVTVTEPPAVTAAGSPVTDVSCFNGNNGSATVNPGGGSGTYTYLWSPAGGNTITANNLSAGNYTVTVTDGNGCTATSTATI